ncbi:MAG: hypothetical protein CL534_10270 [Ahrensia sp.]|nr:hypothetical protein [Ahrensia sp.]
MACAAAVGGVFAQVMISQPGGGAAEETASHGEGVKFPPIAVPIYSQTKKIGYCVMRVEYDGERGNSDEWQMAVAQVSNDLYLEFTTVLDKNADGPSVCAGHIGKRTEKFLIYKAEFYEQIDPNKLQ